jgi:hypothetical protein
VTKGEGSLDGLTFAGKLGPSGSPADVEDSWIFEDGLFISEECMRRCAYPPRPYFTRSVEGATEFVSVTQCPQKNTTITWRGTIDGNAIEGEFEWVVERWYWTIEKTFVFAGQLVKDQQSLASRRLDR